MSNTPGEGVGDRDGLQPPRAGYGGRSMSNASVGFAPRGSSLAASAAPGSFSSELRPSFNAKGALSRGDMVAVTSMDPGQDDSSPTSKEMVAGLVDKLNKEMKIKEGSENLLEALNIKKAKQTKEQRSRVENELNTSNRKIGQLKIQISELQRPKEFPNFPRDRMSNLFRGHVPRSQSQELSPTGDEVTDDEDEETESPTFALAEILQSLEAEAMQPDFYVEKANSLVELFKRHPTLKYDLAWSVFGTRMQTMLLSDSREVVAAGYRMTRYAITDRKSLQIIRGLNTDYLVILSLVKEGKASVEREQALKFVRAFLEVKDGIRELSRAVCRTLVAVAENSEDRLRCICLETLAEILIRDPPLVISAGGVGPLTDALGDGNYDASESLVGTFLYLLDLPSGRRFLRAGYGLEVVFSTFTDSLSMHTSESKLKANAKVIATILKSWSGLMTLSMHGFRAVKSLVASLQFPEPQMRDIILDLLFDVLRIKPPSWSSSFLAGRRLTTYGRVANLKSDVHSQQPTNSFGEESMQFNLVEHYLSLILTVLIEAGLLTVSIPQRRLEFMALTRDQELLEILSGNLEPTLRRKTTLLMGEILKMSSRLLPHSYCEKLQMLPALFSAASDFDADKSVNRTLYRSGTAGTLSLARVQESSERQDTTIAGEPVKSAANVNIDESQFRALMVESHVLSSANFYKWKWDVLQAIAEGPLLNAKRLDEAVRATKFMKRLVGFYRPFKYRFCNQKNTKPNQRYVKVACALVRSLLQTPEGVKYLGENKLLRQVAECLAQLDPVSGLTSASPLFSPVRIAETMSGGYFALLGVLSSDPKGLVMMERWRMTNMCYHIIELQDRSDLVMTLLGNMDFTRDSHFRVMLSKALTASTKDIRIFSTNLLRKYAVQSSASNAPSKDRSTLEWAVRLLVTQLYDPEVDVCERAVKILEEACNDKFCLEYVVHCRPALDHLREIGAPLMLRFLSTSIGYHYLDDLDYITQEMDDWFLGRNDTYVTLVEASLARAMQEPEKVSRRGFEDVVADQESSGLVPPHFYRELTRTAEGCRLLEDKGHFTEFVATLEELGMESMDPEIVLKVKGCLWAVGNVGSMALGARFLESTNVVTRIVYIAEHSEVMTLRGTAFFVMGLISRSVHGLEMLDECGWDSATMTTGESSGLCVPQRLEQLFSIPPWPAESQKALGQERVQELTTIITEEDPVNSRILQLVVDLGNTVLTKRAVSDLMHIKSKKPPGFHETRMFRKVMDILESHHYRLPVRRFIIDLFERSVMRRLVLDEEEPDGFKGLPDVGGGTATAL
ncbi:MAG: 54S ribosomal protein L13 [Chaenotheca gracillima]|nr:MAG: 54S ribosomal protein L13 [Chaenotheca gracillima]